MITCCSTPDCGCATGEPEGFVALSDRNTLQLNVALCVNCGLCTAVCPQGVFVPGARAVKVVRADECMECGACQQNCPTGALLVDSGVGCAAAMISAALTGSDEPCCGGPSSSCCS